MNGTVLCHKIREHIKTFLYFAFGRKIISCSTIVKLLTDKIRVIFVPKRLAFVTSQGSLSSSLEVKQFKGEFLIVDFCIHFAPELKNKKMIYDNDNLADYLHINSFLIKFRPNHGLFL